jgi:hypothetical protein
VTQHRRRQDHQEGDEGEDVQHPHRLVPTGDGVEIGDESRQRVADEGPLLEVRTAVEGDAEHLGQEAADADREQGAEDDGVLGLGLDADPVGPLDVAPHDGPDDAAGEDRTRQVADEGVALVDATVEELQRRGQLVVDLEHRGDRQEHQEAEVDHRVHDAGGGITHQRLHVEAGTQPGQAPLGVLGGDVALVGTAALPVAHPVGEEHCAVDEHQRDDRVEGQLQRSGDVVEHLALDGAVVVPLEDGRRDAGDGDDGTDHQSDDDRDLVGAQSLGPGNLLCVVLCVGRISGGHSKWELTAEVSD